MARIVSCSFIYLVFGVKRNVTGCLFDVGYGTP